MQPETTRPLTALEEINVKALAALRAGDVRGAHEILAKAVSEHPGDAVTRHHYGIASMAAGDAAAAAEAQHEAVRLAPEFYVARLHLAQALERNARPFDALVQYTRAMRDAQSRNRWLNSQSTPEGIRPLVQHAVQQVRGGRRQLFSSLWEPLAQEHGAKALTRVDQCLRIYLGEEAPRYPDERQRPTFLFFPGLPATPYLDPRLFPWVDELEARFPAIRTELLQRMASDQGRERVFGSDALERENLRGAEIPPSWNGYYFYRHGERREDNCASCPATAAALGSLPLARVREHAPEVLFSVFTPGTHLLPHRGVTNTRVVGHLALIVPPDCALSVAGDPYAWQEGRCVVFDDTYEHEAWNRSDRIRVVLIFDLWNPHLTEIERVAVKRLVEAIGDFRAAVEAG